MAAFCHLERLGQQPKGVSKAAAEGRSPRSNRAAANLVFQVCLEHLHQVVQVAVFHYQEASKQ